METSRFCKRPLAMLAAASLLPFALLSTHALAECERGDLDPMYCDENGDMVADRPSDESEWANPDTLIFAYTPVEDPAIYSDIWQPFIDHLSEVTERDVRFFAVQSNAAQVEAMRSGRLHIAGFSTGPTPFAVNLAGAVPFALMGSDDGQFGYTLQLFTHADSDIESLEDLKGKRVAHTSPTSNSGNLAPRALLPELGITPERITKSFTRAAMTNRCWASSHETTMPRRWLLKWSNVWQHAAFTMRKMYV